MKRTEDFFQLDNEWNIIHLPERPNGFAVLIIGDVNHYVTNSTSLWMQHQKRSELIYFLLDKGYTVFYSNLYGKNWGSPQALKLLQHLYHIVMRKQILNSKIHIVAEGMGAILALKYAKERKNTVRSIAMLSPCLDLKAIFSMEKYNKLFYKRFIKELAQAYGVLEKEVEEKIIAPYCLTDYVVNLPLKIWHATEAVNYPVAEHSRTLEKLCNLNGIPITLSFVLFERRFQIEKSLYLFFQQHERQM